MKKTLWIYMMAGCMLVSVVNLAQAEDTAQSDKWQQDKAERMEKRFAEMKQKLGLTDEQQQALKEHRMKFRSSKKSFRQSIRDKKDAIRKELQKQEYDIQSVRKLHEELKSLQAQMDDEQLEAILGVRQILTPSQFAQFSELRKNHRGQPKGLKGSDHRMGSKSE